MVLRISVHDRLIAATACITSYSQKCVSVLARLLRLQCKCDEHNVGLAAHLDLNLKSSSGFLADVSFPALFGSIQSLTASWKAVETKMASASVASSLPALLKWWRKIHDARDGASLGDTILRALQLSAAHTSALVMKSGPMWAWLLKTRPAVASFMSLTLRTLAQGDDEQDIFAMIASPMHTMADVCNQLLLLCNDGAVTSNFVATAAAILRTVENQLEVLLSHPPTFKLLHMLKLSWVQVSKVAFVSALPPPPGLLSAPPLPTAISTASFVPDCIAVIVVVGATIRIVFPCWPWVLQLPCTGSTLDVDATGMNESTSTALLNYSSVGSIHLVFHSKVHEKSWFDLLNKDHQLRASAAADDGDWKICCSIVDTEQRSDLIREYTVYIIHVTHGRLEWKVSRRYSDFEQLVKQLQKELPSWAFLQLLQLPSAKSIGQNLKKNSFAVVEKRRIQLELYLVDVCSRRAACKSNCFRKFLDFQTHFVEGDDAKSNASHESNHASSPSTSSPSLRGAAVAVLASVSMTGAARRPSVILRRVNTAPEPSALLESHAASARISRMTSMRRGDSFSDKKPGITEPAMYSVLYKRGGFHNAGFLSKNSWKNKVVAIWRGLLAYWPAVEEDKMRVEPLDQMGNPTSVVSLVGARITNFAERAHSFEIHVSSGVITLAAHSSEACAAWLSCLVSCIVPSSEAFTPPDISILLGHAPARPTPQRDSPSASLATSTPPPPSRAEQGAGGGGGGIATWFSFPLSSAKDKSDIMQLLLLIAAAQSLLEEMPAVVSSSLADALADMHGEVYSTLRSTATGRSTPDASWIRLKTVTSEAKQDMFQQLLFRVGAISIMGPQQPYALTSASHASGAAVEAVAILLCLRAYLDEQGQPLLLPDDCDVAQLNHPAPVIEFIRALLNLAFFNFPVLELAAPAASGRLSPADASGDGGGGECGGHEKLDACDGQARFCHRCIVGTTNCISHHLNPNPHIFCFLHEPLPPRHVC
jgi:hypothetical protein